ncbi:UTRA domain-containing protein [Nocardia sp. NPDC058499]|uniref:UTRA domain-containing protein n=1 Tax=Nocardia sp. NPDC058499 TaxID=3346530 RepID=UPI00365F71DD
MDGHEVFVTSRVGLLAFVRRTKMPKPSTSEIVAETKLSDRIGVSAGSRWFRIEGPRVVRCAESVPICWSELYLRADLPHRRMMLAGDFDIANLIRQRIEQEVGATVLSAEVAHELQAEKSSAALVVTHRHFHSEGGLEAVGVHTLPVDRYRIVTTIGGHAAAG